MMAKPFYRFLIREVGIESPAMARMVWGKGFILGVVFSWLAFKDRILASDNLQKWALYLCNGIMSYMLGSFGMERVMSASVEEFLRGYFFSAYRGKMMRRLCSLAMMQGLWKERTI
ncbi:hypothetical protein AMTRI_Chr05g67270 [Amborella trichopoda]